MESAGKSHGTMGGCNGAGAWWQRSGDDGEQQSQQQQQQQRHSHRVVAPTPGEPKALDSLQWEEMDLLSDDSAESEGGAQHVATTRLTEAREDRVHSPPWDDAESDGEGAPPAKVPKFDLFDE